jgi:hypothetical protein
MSKTKLHTKKERIVTALTITIIKTPTLHRVGLPRTYKRRSTTTISRLANTGRGVYGANVNNLIDTKNFLN